MATFAHLARRWCLLYEMPTMSRKKWNAAECDRGEGELVGSGAHCPCARGPVDFCPQLRDEEGCFHCKRMHDSLMNATEILA